MAILTSADWPTVRANLDTSVTDKVVTDAQIAMPTFHGRTETWIADRLDPVDPTSLTGSNLAHARNAAIFYLAALLCPIVPQYTSLTADGTLTALRKAFDANGRMLALFDQAESEIVIVEQILYLHPDTGTVNVPTQFRIGSGRRGRRLPIVVIPAPIEFGLP